MIELEAEKRKKKLEAIRSVFRMTRLTERKLEIYKSSGLDY